MPITNYDGKLAHLVHRMIFMQPVSSSIHWPKGLVLGIAFLALSAALSLGIVSGASAQPEKKSILFLNSYHNGYRWSDDVLDGARSILERSGFDIELQIEYMDTKKYPYTDMALMLSDSFRRKFTGKIFDAIIVSDDNGLTFMTEYGRELFGDTPFVFCGINDLTTHDLSGLNVTGVIENADIEALLEMALAFHPGKRKMVVIRDDSTTGQAIANQVLNVVPSFRGRLSFDFWRVEEFEQTLEALSKIDDETLVYFVPMHRYVRGKYYTSEELCSVVAERTNAPLYSNWGFLLGFGTVGGNLINGHAHGQNAAKLALKILEGQRASDIPLVWEDNQSYRFDYKALKRYGIDFELLPDDAVLINTPPSNYELDKEVFWTIMVSLGILLIILALLARNIVRRRAVERKMSEQLSFLELLLDTIPLLISWKDSRQNFLGMNRSFMDFYDLESQEAVADSDGSGELYPPKEMEELADMDRQVIRTQKSIRRRKISLKRPNGETVWLELNKVPLRDVQDKVVGTLTTAENITREVSLEQQLVQSQKMEAIGTMAGGFAHDFNNILTTIINSAELVLTDFSGNSLSRRDLERILTAGKRGSRVVKQILTFSRPTTEGFVNSRIAAAVAEALHLLRPSLPRSIDLKNDVHAEDAVILSDPNQIHQVVMNLCTNSFQAMRDTGGVIAVSLHETDLTEDEAEGLNIPPGPYLKLTIRDDGPGISQNILDKVFDPFFTTKGKAEGTGLGLAVVHGIVKNHKGAIRLSSVPNRDTVFEIYLPRTVDTQRAPKAEPTSLRQGHERILFVEDNEDQLVTTPRILESMGYQVHAEQDAKKALELLEKNQSFDLLITDYDMPGMTGLALALKVSGLLPRLPVIMLSGREQALEVSKQAPNIRKVLIKPYSKLRFSQTIREVLNTEGA